MPPSEPGAFRKLARVARKLSASLLTKDEHIESATCFSQFNAFGQCAKTAGALANADGRTV